uniref:Uncharacterized protein n=1 Tax=viral metagenome TaxID=1070528 RepID=A0A6C0H574_9ZZZZ
MIYLLYYIDIYGDIYDSVLQIELMILLMICGLKIVLNIYYIIYNIKKEKKKENYLLFRLSYFITIWRPFNSLYLLITLNNSNACLLNKLCIIGRFELCGLVYLVIKNILYEICVKMILLFDDGNRNLILFEILD